jgi:hypothetical protein
MSAGGPWRGGCHAAVKENERPAVNPHFAFNLWKHSSLLEEPSQGRTTQSTPPVSRLEQRTFVGCPQAVAQ